MISQLLQSFKIYLYPFVVVLAIACLIARRYDISPVIGRIHAFLQRTGFSTNNDLANEVVRLELLRIVTGLILCHRTLYILLYMPLETTSGLEWAAACFVMVFAMAFTAGLFTPLAGFFLLLVIQPFDYFLRTSTLGSDVLQMILLVLVFAPAGSALSADVLIRRRRNTAAGALATIDKWFGSPTIPRVSVLRFLALVSYGMLCIYSVLFHLTDPAWVGGYANALLLSSSYLSRFHTVFRDLFQTYPELSLRIAQATLYGMMAWEALLLPMVFLHRVTRAIIIAWGLLFFVVSTFLLQLGWLSYYEYVLWAILFWQGWWLNTGNRSTIKLLYDDRCNLCDSTVRFLSRVDVFGIIRFQPLSKNRELLDRHGIDAKEALQDLYGIDEARGRLYKGYDLYTTLAARLLLLAPAWPMFVIGRLVRLGPAIYQWIARRRIELFGVCELPAPLSSRGRTELEIRADAVQTRTERSLFAAIVLTYAVFLFIFVARLPHVEKLGPLAGINNFTKKYFEEAYETVGLAPINVFNAQDMRLSEAFFTMERLAPSGDWQMVPFTGPMGERLKWHESDKVYFGNSLLYRRSTEDRTCISPWQMRFIRELVALDREKTAVNVALYRIRYFQQFLPDSEELKRFRFAYPDIKLTCEVEYDPGLQSVSRIERLL